MQFVGYLFILCIIQSCSASVREKVANPGGTKDIKSIKVLNKTQNKFIPGSINITDTAAILKIVEQVKKMKEFKIDNVKANFGFYELDFTYENQKNYEIDVIYTIYEGVVIRDLDGKTYKNDGLETLILYYFQNPDLQGAH